jgi:amino acid transporter
MSTPNWATATFWKKLQRLFYADTVNGIKRMYRSVMDFSKSKTGKIDPAWRNFLIAILSVSILGIAVALVTSPAFLMEFLAARLLFVFLLFLCLAIFLLWLHEKHRSSGMKILGGVSTLISVCLIVFIAFPWINAREDFFLEIQKQKVLSQNELEPGIENKESSSVESFCPYIVLLGNSFFGTNHFPFSVISADGKDILSMDLDDNKHLVISFDAYDNAGNLLVRVSKNEVIASPLHTIPEPRKTTNSVSYLDEKGNPIIAINYLNSKKIKVTGDFFADNGHRIKITNDTIYVDGIDRFGQNAFCDNYKGLVIE